MRELANKKWMRKREHFSYLNGGLVAKRWHMCLNQLKSAVNISALKIIKKF